MIPMRVPEEGLVLHGPPYSPLDSNIVDASVQPQVMRLDLATGVLEEIVRASRMGKDIHMSFGKSLTLHYGSRSQQLLSIAQPTPSELYNYTPDQEDELRFAGLFTHKLAQKKIQEDTAGVDAAMAALKSKMADHQQNKQNKQIKILSDTPTASPRLNPNHLKPKPSSSFAQLNKTNTPVVRSVPSTPAVIPSRRPPATGPSWEPSAKERTDSKEKMEALKIPLLHLVAIRPMSLKFLANKVACTQDKCKEILEKLGKPARLDPEKWDLTDKAFKELSVWDFKYELDDDRELAIEHAVSAYDRMRLSREDKLWQMLLPREERGKGKILSKLQLHQGPIQKNSTPRIHVQGAADDQVNDDPAAADVQEKYHLTPGDATTPMARPQPSDQIKKKRVSEQEAQSKRLLSSGPKKAAAAAKAKDLAKKRGTKKGAVAAANVKSAEFVHESDEDEVDAVHAPANVAPKPAVTKVSADSPKAPPKTKPLEPADSIEKSQDQPKAEKGPQSSKPPIGSKVRASSKTPSTTGTPTSKHRLSDASQTSSSGSKLSRQRTTSSPHKPSPLGSSPPTNASDLDNDSQLQLTSNSSTSSTPLNAQGRNAVTGLKPRPEAGKRLPTSVETCSQPSLKRKAAEVPSGGRTADLPVTNGQMAPAAKRVKTSVPSPPTTDSSSNASPMQSEEVMGQAERFKKYYAKYQVLYEELAGQTNPALEKMDKLMEWHRRLQSMKDDISRAVIANK
ncbi:MAG: hypothetical protein Q9223_000175 [Gallowayella weberi]